MSDKQIILAVDDKGNFTGEYVDKDLAHTGKGIHHLAITAFIYNSKGEVLLQRRKHKNFDNLWDNTVSTHQLHLENGSDETDEQATLRALKREFEIGSVEDLKNLGGFNYFAKDSLQNRPEGADFAQDKGRCENEFCKLLIGRYDGEILLNEEVGYGYKWMDKEEFLKDVEINPKSYTPWTIEAVKTLKEIDF